MEITAIAVSSFLVALSGALMPGPLTTVLVAHAVRRGHAAGPLVSLGHGLVEVSLVIALVLGLSQFLKMPLVMAATGLLGGLCLLYMGAGMIREPAPASVESLDATPASRGTGPIAAGALASVSNPYWVLWWSTIGTTYLLLTLEHGLLGIAAFYLGHFLADFGWFTAMGSAVTAGRRLMTPRVYKGVMAACGAFLLCLGVYFLFSGVDTLQHI